LEEGVCYSGTPISLCPMSDLASNAMLPMHRGGAPLLFSLEIFSPVYY